MPDKDKFISLKEASELSGYSSDYIGQLIRGGKIPGRQVYANIAWMTTKEAVLEYKRLKEGGKNGNAVVGGPAAAGFRKLKVAFLSEPGMAKLIRLGLYSGIIFSVIVCLMLFYIFSVSVERRLEQRALERIEAVNP